MTILPIRLALAGYWQTQYQSDGRKVSFPQGSYSGEVYKNFAFNFFRHHQAQPFFFYYAPHNIHAPIQRTPATAKHGTGNLYEDNIRYLDAQVGAIVAELENLGIRDRTLVIFSGDNGTVRERSSPIGGRLLDGYKDTMREGGARVPFIANWPGVTPAGQVSQDIISFADALVTFAQLAGAALPDAFVYDGWSFAPQLLGQPGTPRPWAYVQFGPFWYVREPGFKMNDKGELFDMSDAPFSESLVDSGSDTVASREARARLAAALHELNPAAGITDARGPSFFDPAVED